MGTTQQIHLLIFFVIRFFFLIGSKKVLQNLIMCVVTNVVYSQCCNCIDLSLKSRISHCGTAASITKCLSHLFQKFQLFDFHKDVSVAQLPTANLLQVGLTAQAVN